VNLWGGDTLQHRRFPIVAGCCLPWMAAFCQLSQSWGQNACDELSCAPSAADGVVCSSCKEVKVGTKLAPLLLSHKSRLDRLRAHDSSAFF